MNKQFCSKRLCPDRQQKANDLAKTFAEVAPEIPDEVLAEMFRQHRDRKEILKRFNAESQS